MHTVSPGWRRQRAKPTRSSLRSHARSTSFRRSSTMHRLRRGGGGGTHVRSRASIGAETGIRACTAAVRSIAAVAAEAGATAAGEVVGADVAGQLGGFPVLPLGSPRASSCCPPPSPLRSPHMPPRCPSPCAHMHALSPPFHHTPPHTPRTARTTPCARLPAGATWWTPFGYLFELTSCDCHASARRVPVRGWTVTSMGRVKPQRQGRAHVLDGGSWQVRTVRP